MRKLAIALVALLVLAAGGLFFFQAQKHKAAEQQAKAEEAASAAAEAPAPALPLAGARPAFAFTMAPAGPVPPPIPEDAEIRRIPGSPVSVTLGHTKDRFDPPDWWPKDHPAEPDIVAHGRKPDLFACSYCHLPNGLGRPENAPLAGKSAAYIVAQMAAFKAGDRPGVRMPAIAKLVTDQDIAGAAAYFSSLKARPWIKVVETASVPKTQSVGGLLTPIQPIQMEPIGERLIEVAKDNDRTELRDARSSFIAYVPVGAVARGKMIARSANDAKKACSSCHGDDLRGSSKAPAIAGRSPSYAVRELYELQTGERHDPDAKLMAPIVADLTINDMIAVAAYVATLKP